MEYLLGQKLKLRDFHPERVLLGIHTRKWPRPVRQAASLFLAFAGWYGLFSSALAILSSLAFLEKFWAWVKETSIEIYPRIIVIFDALYAIIEIWRILTRPIYEYCFGWWPIEVPRSVLDILIIISIVLVGYFRSWMASRPYKQFLKMMDPRLSLEGRVALVKRIVASVDAIDRGLTTHSPLIADKGEQELTMALDEIAPNTDPVEFLKVLENVLDLPPEELQDNLMQVALAAQHERKIWYTVFGRSIITGVILFSLVLFDVYWRSLH